MALCLQGVYAHFCIRRSFGCGWGVITPDGIMRPVERGGLAEAGRLGPKAQSPRFKVQSRGGIEVSARPKRLRRAGTRRG